MNQELAARAMQRGMAFIKSVQQPDGSFTSLSSPSETPFKSVSSYQTVFGPALILASLARLDTPTAMIVRKKLAGWLLDQKSPSWSFNYWAKSSPQRASLPYPDDLDDTFCALIALYRHDPSIINAECLGGVVRLLTAAEQQVGGPYCTWLVGSDTPKVWRDIDLAVNSNIAYFLGLVAEPLPNLTAMIETAIKTRSFTSPYYTSAYPILYYLGRAYHGPLGNELTRYIKQRQRGGWWGSPLNTSLAILSLTSQGATDGLAQAWPKLLSSQLPDGSWPAEAFCLDPAIKGRAHYSGSAALTTALAIEALSSQPPARIKASVKISPTSDKRADIIYKKAADMAAGGNQLSALTRQNIARLNYMKAGDKDNEIVLLPYIFNDSLLDPIDSKQRGLLVNLSLGNLYGWTAYTIYDDFLDGEGDPKLLSVANSALRKSLKCFGLALPGNQRFHKLVDDTFDTIDQANAWELEHCRMAVSGKNIVIGRLPKFTKILDLADRSLGHTLPIAGVLAAGGIPIDDSRARSLLRATRHYLVARQLNDDLHDWEKDLRGGLSTFVVTTVLRELSLPAGEHSLDDLMPKLQRQFWHHTLNQVCRVMRKHTAMARRYAESSHLLGQPNIITELVDKIDASVDKTLLEQSEAKSFLDAYRGTKA